MGDHEGFTDGLDGRNAIVPARCLPDHGWVKVKQVIKLLERDGWVQVRMKGSHRHFKHPVKPGTATVAGKPSDDLAVGTFLNILKQAGLR